LQGEEEKNNSIDSNSIEKPDFDYLNGLIESAIFVSEEPITIKQLAALTGQDSQAHRILSPWTAGNSSCRNRRGIPIRNRSDLCSLAEEILQVT
jgi:hypothetical protein